MIDIFRWHGWYRELNNMVWEEWIEPDLEYWLDVAREQARGAESNIYIAALAMEKPLHDAVKARLCTVPAEDADILKWAVEGADYYDMATKLIYRAMGK